MNSLNTKNQDVSHCKVQAFKTLIDIIDMQCFTTNVDTMASKKLSIFASFNDVG